MRVNLSPGRAASFVLGVNYGAFEDVESVGVDDVEVLFGGRGGREWVGVEEEVRLRLLQERSVMGVRFRSAVR